MYRADTWAEADNSRRGSVLKRYRRKCQKRWKKKQRKGESEGKYFRRQINKQQNEMVLTCFKH
jgi:hypothetical protein